LDKEEGMFTLLVAALAVAVLVLVVLTVVLNWDKIKGLFQKLKAKNGISSADKEKIGFSIKNALQDPSTPYVEGIFNKRTNEVVDGEKLATRAGVDSDFDREHNKTGVVIYN
jgi:uncharacterized protein involved in outer membrane biogenesis